jgi:peptide/nickel transport system substrate-binding protein
MSNPFEKLAEAQLTRRELMRRGGLGVAAVGLAPLLGARVAQARPTAAYKAAARANTLVLANFDVATVLDPESPARGAAPTSEALANIFEPLLMYKFKPGPGGIPVPDFYNYEGRLAESWTVSKDKTTYTLKLRKDVKSIWGNSLTADDYLWSVQRAFNVKGIGRTVQSAGGVTDPSMVEALDAHTLRFNLGHPNPLFLHTRTTYLSPVLDSTEVKKHVTASDPTAAAWIAANGGGFGPYTVVRAVAGSQTVFKAVGGFYRGKQPFSLVVVDAVPDTAARLSSLNGRAIDGAEFLAYQQVASIAGNEDVYVANALPGNANQWLILNTQYPPLSDKRVRQAIAYAMPYNDITKGIYRGLGQVYKNVIPLSYPNVSTKFWHYDTDLTKAKSLLAAGGQGSGFDVKVTYPEGRIEDEQVAIVVGDALSKIGIRPTLDKATAAVFAQLKLGALKSQSQIMVSSGDIPFFPDIVFASIFFFRSDALFNRGWANKHFDYLSDKAAHEGRPSYRTQQLHQMQQILMDELPYIGIAMTGRPFAFRSDIKGYMWYPDDWLRFFDLRRVR